MSTSKTKRTTKTKMCGPVRKEEMEDSDQQREGDSKTGRERERTEKHRQSCRASYARKRDRDDADGQVGAPYHEHQTLYQPASATPSPHYASLFHPDEVAGIRQIVNESRRPSAGDLALAGLGCVGTAFQCYNNRDTITGFLKKLLDSTQSPSPTESTTVSPEQQDSLVCAQSASLIW